MGLEGGHGLSDEYLPPYKQRVDFFPFMMVPPVAYRPVSLPLLLPLRSMIPCSQVTDCSRIHGSILTVPAVYISGIKCYSSSRVRLTSHSLVAASMGGLLKKAAERSGMWLSSWQTTALIVKLGQLITSLVATACLWNRPEGLLGTWWRHLVIDMGAAYESMCSLAVFCNFSSAEVLHGIADVQG